MNDSIIEISFNERYGINGQHPCQADYVEVFGEDGNSYHSLGKKCHLSRPDTIRTSSNRARVVFQGSARHRTPTRVGFSISYVAVEKGRPHVHVAIINAVIVNS